MRIFFREYVYPGEGNVIEYVYFGVELRERAIWFSKIIPVTKEQMAEIKELIDNESS